MTPAQGARPKGGASFDKAGRGGRAGASAGGKRSRDDKVGRRESAPREEAQKRRKLTTPVDPRTQRIQEDIEQDLRFQAALAKKLKLKKARVLPLIHI